MPWHWRVIGMDCAFPNVQAQMASPLDDRWRPFGQEAEAAVAKLYRVSQGTTESVINLPGCCSDADLHHQVEDGIILREENLLPDYNYEHFERYILCRWSGPKSIVTVEREQISGDEHLVRAYNINGAQILEKRCDCAKTTWFALAQDVYAQEDSIKNLMFVEGNTVVNRIWWPLRLDQKLPPEAEEWRAQPDELEDMWCGCNTRWGEVVSAPADELPACFEVSSGSDSTQQSSSRSRSRSRGP